MNVKLMLIIYFNNSTRSVAESVSENLLMNISIKYGTSDSRNELRNENILETW